MQGSDEYDDENDVAQNDLSREMSLDALSKTWLSAIN